MMKIYKNSNGFTLVEALLIVIALTLISFAGWYVWSRNSTDNIDSTTIKKSVTKEASNKSDPPKVPEFSLSTKLTSLNNAFSLSVPDGWVFTNDTDQDYAYALEMSYKKGEPAKINKELGHRGDGFTKTSFVVEYSKESLKNYFGASQADGALKLNNGKEAKKYLSVASDNEGGSPVGTKYYGYQIDYEEGTIIVSYLVNPTDKDELALVEASIKTLSF